MFIFFDLSMFSSHTQEMECLAFHRDQINEYLLFALHRNRHGSNKGTIFMFSRVWLSRFQKGLCELP